MFYSDPLSLSPDEVLVYLRKSRSDDPSLTVEEVLMKHEAMLDEWAERNLGSVVPSSNKYREVVSGETIKDRPEIQAMLKRIESPKYKAILLVEVQRLSRGDLEDAGRLIKLLRYTGTKVLTLQKIYDINDDYDRDFFERELKRGNEFLEYTKKIMTNGRLLSVSQGNYIGSVPPYGYDKVWVAEGKKKYPTLAINPAQANTVKLIFAWFINEDLGRTKIANRLNDMKLRTPKGKFWSPNTVRDILSNVHYNGKVKWNWRKVVNVVNDGEIVSTRPKSRDGDYLIYNGKHEAIISDEMFEKAQAKIGKNHREKAQTTIRNPLAGILFCRCGRAMAMQSYKKPHPSLRLVCPVQNYCETASCEFEAILERIKMILRENIHDFEVKSRETSSETIKEHEAVIKDLQKQLSILEAKELAQWEAQYDPDPSLRIPPDIFKRLNEKLQNEKSEIVGALIHAKETLPHPEEYAEKLSRFQSALSALSDPNMTPLQQNMLLKSCIERITYSREKPHRLNRAIVAQNNLPVSLKAGSNWSESEFTLQVKLHL